MTKDIAKQKNTTRWILDVAGSKAGYVIWLMVLQSILGGSSVLYAILFRDIIDAAVAGSQDGFVHAAIRFGGLIVVQLALRALLRFLLEFTHSSIENRFKSRLFSNLMRRDYASVTAVHSGEWMNRLTSDTVVVANGVTHIVPGLAELAVKLVGALVVITVLEPMFTYILVPGGLLLVGMTYAFRKVLKRLHKLVQEKDGALRVVLQERLESLLIVRSFGAEAQTEAAADAAMESHQRARMQRNHFSNFCNVGFGTAMRGLYAFGVIYCGWHLLLGTMSYGTLNAVLQLIGQIQSPFANITSYLPQYYSMLASAERLMEVESFPLDVEDTVSAAETRRYYREELVSFGLRDASFTYQPPARSDEQPEMPQVFEHVDLTVGKGEYIAFTGPSGCGKSTVLKLLLSLYPLDSGERYLRGDRGELPLTGAWRSLFAYVPQGNHLLSGSIREIIAFGDQTRMRDETLLWKALEIACADGFVRTLSAGLDTVLGERGAGLSEGQMQRIAIARAICSECPILLLDECTSALDDATEAQVLRNLRAMTDKTVLIVTHRSAALSVCEKQVAFSAGKIRQTEVPQ
ncbi:MAG: ABC transporter ATP-binding protein [Oscillospiraceae bacterium]|nr:ABC transporter ATP-binding protein [Oscillospiraceae bacterium]